MKLNIRILFTLFKKDLRDVLKNANGLFMLLLPLFFSVLYSVMDFGGEFLGSGYVLMLCCLMCMCMVPVSFLSMIIAEEKEKNTLRTLMLSNVSAAEFILSKALVTYVMMELVMVASFFIVKYAVSALPSFILITTLSSFCVIFLGALIGIVSKNQMSTGIFSTPIMLVLLIPPIFGQMNNFFAGIAKFTPTNAMMQLFFSLDAGLPLSSSDNLFQIAVIAVWTVLAAAVFVMVYRKKRLDN